jgi:hypothetical protein
MKTSQQYPTAEMERMMKLQGVLLKARARKNYLVGGSRDQGKDSYRYRPIYYNRKKPYWSKQSSFACILALARHARVVSTVP